MPDGVAPSEHGAMGLFPAPAPAPATVPGLGGLHRFGDYELIEEIARGGMGVVYRARQISLDRVVALKMLPFGRLAGGDLLKRFRLEAEVIASLRHPNIVPIHAFGEMDGQPYFSMDLIEGGDLADLVRDRPLTERRAAEVLRTVAEAVSHSHERGILHRDLKPTNILLDAAGQPHLTDFGLAKIFELGRGELEASASRRGDSGAGRDWTATGHVVGTPSYMSPEQAGGRRNAIGFASDVYSLGAVLYFLVTGRAPFTADSLEEILRQVHENDPVPPRVLNPSLSRDLETICLKCLSKEPARRYGSARALAEDLGRFCDGEPVRARSHGAVDKVWRWCRRRPAVTGLLCALVAVSAAGLGGIIWQWREARASAASERRQRERAEATERTARTNLWNSYLAQARASRQTGQAGRRFDAIEALGKAAAMRVTAELRDEAIAALALSDFRASRRAVNSGSSLVAFDAQLARYATTNSSHGVLIRSVVDDSVLAELPSIGARIDALVGFDAMGARLAARYRDGSFKIWDLESKEAVFTGRCARDWCGAGVDFSPDGRHLAVANGRKEVAIWELPEGRLVATHEAPFSAVAVRYSHDGRLLAVTRRGEAAVAVLEAASGQLVSTLSSRALPYDVAWHPDGEWLAVAAGDSRVYLHDARSGRRLQTFSGHTEDLMSVSFVPDSSLLISVGFDGLRVWNFLTGEQAVSALETGVVRVSGDGRRLALVRHGVGEFALFDFSIGSAAVHHFAREMEGDTSSQGVAFCPDGSWLAYAAGNDLKLVGRKREFASATVGSVKSLLFDSGNNLWVSGQRGCYRWPRRADAPAGVWALGPPEPVIPDTPTELAAVSRDGRRVVVCEATNMHAFAVETGLRLSTMLGNAPKTSVAVSPDGELVASCIWDTRYIRLWNLQDGTVRTNLVPPQWNGDYNSAVLAFSPDGRWLLASSLWPDTCGFDTRDWSLRWQRPRAGDLGYVAVSPDGTMAAVREAKRMVHLLIPETGERLGVLESSEIDAISRMEFSPDGAQLCVVGTARRVLVIWDLRGLRSELASLGLDWNRSPLVPRLGQRGGTTPVFWRR